MKFKNKMLLFCTVCIMTVPAKAQFGKLKGLVAKKDKSATVVATKEEKIEMEPATNAAAGLTSERAKASTAAWVAEFDRGIDWFKLSATGKLIIATADGLYGVEPSSGKVAWKHDFLKNLDEDNYNAIPQSPFIAIVTGGMMNMQQVILDVSSGKIIADTKALGMKMVSKRYTIPALGGILFTGYLDNMPSLVFIDAATGEKKWVLNKIFENNSEVLVAKPLADGNNLLMVTNKRIYKIDVTKGTVSWKADFKTDITDGILATETKDEVDQIESTKNGEKKGGIGSSLGKLGGIPGIGGLGKVAGAAGGINKLGGMGGSMRSQTAQLADVVFGKFLILDNQPGLVYYYNNQQMIAFDLASGQVKWGEVKFSDPLAQVLFDERGFLIATDDKRSELFLLDYQTGAAKWKPVTLKGKITALKLNGTALAIASAKESGKNYINIVDLSSGKAAAVTDMKVTGQIMDIRQNKQGLIYRTNRELNIQDIQTGKDVWPKSLSYKEGGMGADRLGKSYVWASNQLYLMDNEAGSIQPIGKTLKFEGGEIPNTIEIRENGVFVSAAQNMALFDWEGNLIYKVYHKAPGTSLANKILNITAIAVSSANSAQSGFQAGLAGPNTTTYNSNMANADRWSNVGTAALNDMKRRFTATQNSKNYQTILTEVEDGDEKGYGLVRIHKDTGKTIGQIILKDKKPDYLADETENVIFYKNNSKSIAGYKL